MGSPKPYGGPFFVQWQLGFLKMGKVKKTGAESKKQHFKSNITEK